MKLEARSEDSVNLGLLNVAIERLGALHKEYSVYFSDVAEPVRFLDANLRKEAVNSYKENVADVNYAFAAAFKKSTIVYRNLYRQTLDKLLKAYCHKENLTYSIDFNYNNDFDAIVLKVTIDKCIYDFNIRANKD